MPSRHKVSISPAARNDLADILTYLVNRWNEERAPTIVATLKERIPDLARFPLLELVDFPW